MRQLPTTDGWNETWVWFLRSFESLLVGTAMTIGLESTLNGYLKSARKRAKIVRSEPRDVSRPSRPATATATPPRKAQATHTKIRGDQKNRGDQHRRPFPCLLVLVLLTTNKQYVESIPYPSCSSLAHARRKSLGTAIPVSLGGGGHDGPSLLPRHQQRHSSPLFRFVPR